jgi:hypothetical protein
VALLAVGAVAGCGRRQGAMLRRMPFMRCSTPKYAPHSQTAIARWTEVSCAATPISSDPRQAIGRT